MTIGQARQSIADAQARAELYRMWHAGQRAGLTHERSLDSMGVRTGSATAERLRTELIEGFRQRSTLADLAHRNAALLQPFERALLAAGDESGSLEQSLATLASHYAAEQKLLRTVWSKLTYPLITSLIAILITPLPLLVAGNTRAYVAAVAGGVFAWYMFGGVVVSALAARYANRREFVLARLARALAGGMEAGLPLDRIAVLAADATGHPAVIAHVRARSSRQHATQPLSETFSGCSIIPFEMIASMKVAETSGDYSTGMRRLATLYDGRAT